MNTKIIFICSIFSLGLKIVAQTTLTATGCNPVIGDNLNINYSAYVNPGAAGASQTWNLASMTATSSNTLTYVNPASTTYGSSFPGSNLCMQSSNGGVPGYLKTSSAAYQICGFATPSVVVSYSNFSDFLHFPFTYNSTYTDAFAATFVVSGYTFYRTGTVTVIADGWGTVTTPAGIFSNVLRVHLTENYQDSVDYGGISDVNYYSSDQYFWYKEGVHASLANVWTQTATTTTSGGSYLTNAVGINEINEIENYSIFPNPSTDVIVINFNAKQNNIAKIKIVNALGSIIREETIQVQQGNNTCKKEILDLPNGIYFAEINIGEAVHTKRFIVVK